MDDLISRQYAIDAILADKIDAISLKVMTALGDGRLALTLNDACDRHIRAIEQLPSAQPEPRWISCNDRLPDKDGDYLVYYDEGYRADYGFDEIGIAPFEVDCEGFGIWQEEFDSWTLGSLGSDWVDIKVVAWMPLPTPYREE